MALQAKVVVFSIQLALDSSLISLEVSIVTKRNASLGGANQVPAEERRRTEIFDRRVLGEIYISDYRCSREQARQIN